MKKVIRRLFQQTGIDIVRYNKREKFYHYLFDKYKDYTMMEHSRFVANLHLCEQYKNIEGDYAECGVWRGGMSAAISEVVGKNKKIYLFDSFEGLPPAQEIDGAEALEWQRNKNSPSYFDNCSAEKKYAMQAMDLARHQNYEIYQGWFSDTLPAFEPTKLGILRLDGDWFDSIITSLKYLYPMVVENGLIIIDDYPYWAGCSRAVHRYLNEINSASSIHEITNTVAYIIKKDKPL